MYSLFYLVSFPSGEEAMGSQKPLRMPAFRTASFFFMHQVVVRSHGYRSVARCFQYPFGSIPTYVKERTEVCHLHAAILGYFVTKDLELAGSSRRPSLRMLFK